MEKTINNNQDFTKKFTEMKGKRKEKVSRTLSLQLFEYQVISDFLDENNISLATFIMHLLLQDGAITDEMVDAFFKVYPRANREFVSLDNITFNYKSKYADTNFKEILAASQTKVWGLNLFFVFDQQVGTHLKKKGFQSYIQYFRHLINQADVYPVGMWEELQNHIKTDFIEEYTEQQIKRKAYEKKRRRQKDMNYIAIDEEQRYKPAVFAISNFEKTEIVDPFIGKLKQKDLTFSQIIRYELVQEGILRLDNAFLDKKILTKLKNFIYKAKAKYETQTEYKNLQKTSKSRKNIMVTLTNDAESTEVIGGNFGTFVKQYVLRKHGAYPTLENGNDASIAFINKVKLAKLNEKMKTLNREHIQG